MGSSLQDEVSHRVDLVRPLVDDWVDRPEVARGNTCSRPVLIGRGLDHIHYCFASTVRFPRHGREFPTTSP